jgi:dethiobiotin synthetase
VSRRIYLVGTDTAVGKTTLACALLHAARREGVRVLPFKPAQSVPAGTTSDAARLHAAADPRLAVRVDALAPHSFERALAPGIAQDPSPFVGRGPGAGRGPDAIGRAQWALARLEARVEPDLVLIEGAGGLHVPMPGGTWQPEWISAFEARPLVVARAGLGTINHTISTVEGLRARSLEPLGFAVVQLGARRDPSRRTNAAVIAHATGLSCLARLPYRGRGHEPAPDDADVLELVPDFWTRLRG